MGRLRWIQNARSGEAGTEIINKVYFGKSATPYSYTAGYPAMAMYFTSSNTTSTNAEPIYVKSIMTGAGGYGGRCRFHAYTNVALGANFMGLKSITEFGDSGTISGLAAGFCAELVMPNADTGSGGGYCVLELEYVAGGTSLVTAGSLSGNHASFIRMTASGDTDGDFDDHGFLMTISGLTAGSTHLYQTGNTQAGNVSGTLKIGVGTTTHYITLYDAEATTSG